MKILGISAFYHDSAAALVVDGKVLGAVQEERFSRKKHDSRLPRLAVAHLLREAGLSIHDLDEIVYYEKPGLKFQRLLASFLANPSTEPSHFATVVGNWLKFKLRIPKLIAKELGYAGRVRCVKHHVSHAASAFFPSPFGSAAVLTIDGVGEWETTTYGTGRGNRLELTHAIRFPHSLGMLYSAFTHFTGFKVNSAEYKVMGLAPYGTPKYLELMRKHLIDLKADGSYRLNMEYFSYDAGPEMVSEKLSALFGRKARSPESLITQDDMDITASLQCLLEEAVLRMAKHIRKETGEKALCLAGGVALNCVANGKIIRDGIFDRVWIQPASGDAGGALGAALYSWHEHHSGPRSAEDQPSDNQRGSLLGPSFSNGYIGSFLELNGIPFERPAAIEKHVAQLLADGKIVAWFSGPMEFGPRALGSRSIIGDPRRPEMQKNMNLKIKFRESFRPFAPAVLFEHQKEYFDLDELSPYMLVVAPVREGIRKSEPAESSHLEGIEKLNLERSTIPAVTHVDYSARVQSITEQSNPRFRALLGEFRDLTGCPVLINTSFNVRGEPIVCTPEDAFRCFMRTDMDYLVLEDYLLDKKQQRWIDLGKEWQSEFELD